MTEVFNPSLLPESGPTVSGTFAVQQIQYGEGYVGTVAEGINNHHRTWPVTFKGSTAEVEAIQAFFIAHKGYISFQWTPPVGPVGLWQVREYTMIPEAADNASISATFVEHFHP